MQVDKVHMEIKPEPAPAVLARDLPESPVVATFTIDVLPERRLDFLAAMEVALVQSAREPGVTFFMLLANRDDPNRFTAVDVFRDREAYELHLVAPQTQNLVAALHGCLRNPPAGKLHHLLAIKEELPRETVQIHNT